MQLFAWFKSPFLSQCIFCTLKANRPRFGASLFMMILYNPSIKIYLKSYLVDLSIFSSNDFLYLITGVFTCHCITCILGYTYSPCKDVIASKHALYFYTHTHTHTHSHIGFILFIVPPYCLASPSTNCCVFR